MGLSRASLWTHLDGGWATVSDGRPGHREEQDQRTAYDREGRGEESEHEQGADGCFHGDPPSDLGSTGDANAFPVLVALVASGR